jgi:hypothetical protein
MMLAGAVGGMLIVGLLLLRERGLIQPLAATEAIPDPPRAAASSPSVIDEPARIPTYPIPPEVIAKLRAQQTSSAPTESTTAPVSEGKRATVAASHAREHAPARRVALAQRSESRAGNARGTAPAAVRAPTPSAAVAVARSPQPDHAATPTSTASAPAAEPRKRVPLVDDQPRVRLLE